MDEVAKIILYTLCAGACIPLGALIAHKEKIRPSWLENEFRHSVIAFGGGILVAAVALVLVPEGVHHVGGSFLSVGAVLAGGICFFYYRKCVGGPASGKAAIDCHASRLRARILGAGRRICDRLSVCTPAGSVYWIAESSRGI